MPLSTARSITRFRLDTELLRGVRDRVAIVASDTCGSPSRDQGEGQSALAQRCGDTGHPRTVRSPAWHGVGT